MFFSATKDMIRANLDAFFAAKSDGMSSDDALHFMILTRYGPFPKRREEFIGLYALFLSFLENPETSDIDFSDSFGVLKIVLSSFHLHHESPEDIDEKEKRELEILRGVISLMHMYESGAIFKSTQSVLFPTVEFLDNFINNTDKEYYKRLRIKQAKIKQAKIKQESSTGSKFKSREEYEAWKARKIKENEQKRQGSRAEENNMNHCYQILGLKPNASKKEVEQAHEDLLTIWNPDEFADEIGLQEKALEKVKEIDEAYKKLMLHWTEPL
jgi:hypothetical protein